MFFRNSVIPARLGGLAAWLVVAKQIVLLGNIGEVIIIIKIIAFILEGFATRVTCNFLS